ncbi:MAG: MBL fold metallo-hydrolase [Anaerolineae bacterium]|nr:MBL fold metallo-hydrolase [Anaerolineae bacterium]
MSGRKLFIVSLVIGLLIVGCSQPGQSVEPVPTYETFGDPYKRIDIAADLYLREVQNGAYVITQDTEFAANSLLVEMADSTLVLVDTPYTIDATRELHGWIIEQYGDRKLIEINTGFHDDNLAGNSYLISRGVTVFGADLTADLLKEHNSPNAPPTNLYPIDEGLELTFGSEIVRVYYPGPTHTLDNVVVYFPDRHLLFGGCMVSGWGGIGSTDDADLDAWPVSLKSLEQFDADLAIPGHGDNFNPENIAETIEALENLE